MNAQAWIALVGVLLQGIILAVVIHDRRSFGSYTERVERTNEATRRSNELTRQSNDRTLQHLEAERLKVELAQAKYTPHSDRERSA